MSAKIACLFVRVKENVCERSVPFSLNSNALLLSQTPIRIRRPKVTKGLFACQSSNNVFMSRRPNGIKIELKLVSNDQTVQHSNSKQSRSTRSNTRRHACMCVSVVVSVFHSLLSMLVGVDFADNHDSGHEGEQHARLALHDVQR